MSVQTVSVTPTIEWDDSVVFVFSFNVPTGDGGSTQFFAGFVHTQLQVATAVGSSVQVTAIVSQTNQQQIQFATDPQSWLDTVKNAFRNAKPISITFEDVVNTPYTTQTAQNFKLQQLFSLAG
jgi:hypothetical protein